MIEVKLGIINFNTGNISISQNLFETYISTEAKTSNILIKS